jgi:hypothetical protein
MGRSFPQIDTRQRISKEDGSIMVTEEMVDENEKDLSAIASVLNEDLVVEILWSAMHYLKNNSEMGIDSAIALGYNEWIK